MGSGSLRPGRLLVPSGRHVRTLTTRPGTTHRRSPVPRRRGHRAGLPRHGSRGPPLRPSGRRQGSTGTQWRDGHCRRRRCLRTQCGQTARRRRLRGHRPRGAGPHRRAGLDRRLRRCADRPRRLVAARGGDEPVGRPGRRTRHRTGADRLRQRRAPRHRRFPFELESPGPPLRGGPGSGARQPLDAGDGLRVGDDPGCAARGRAALVRLRRRLGGRALVACTRRRPRPRHRLGGSDSTWR